MPDQSFLPYPVASKASDAGMENILQIVLFLSQSQFKCMEVNLK